jgi:predicted peroxiredoxin
MQKISKVIIVMASGSPDQPAVAATAWVYAQTARALDLDVEVHLTGRAVLWAFDGVADQVFSDQAKQQSIRAFIVRCAQMGIRIYVCGMAMREYHQGQTLIAEITGQAGTTTVIGELLQDDRRVLVF